MRYSLDRAAHPGGQSPAAIDDAVRLPLGGRFPGALAVARRSGSLARVSPVHAECHASWQETHSPSSSAVTVISRPAAQGLIRPPTGGQVVPTSLYLRHRAAPRTPDHRAQRDRST
jgi:hypothetical protein